MRVRCDVFVASPDTGASHLQGRVLWGETVCTRAERGVEDIAAGGLGGVGRGAFRPALPAAPLPPGVPGGVLAFAA